MEEDKNVHYQHINQNQICEKKQQLFTTSTFCSISLLTPAE